MVLPWCIGKHCSRKCLFSTPPRQNAYVAVFWPITDIGCCVGHKKGFQTEKHFPKNSPLRLSCGSYTLRPSPECHVPMVLICYNEPTNGTCLVVRPVFEPSIGRRHVGCVFVMFVVVPASAGTLFFCKSFCSGGTKLYCMIPPDAEGATSTVGQRISPHGRCRVQMVGSIPCADVFATRGSWRSQIAARAAAFFARASLTSEVVSRARFSLSSQTEGGLRWLRGGGRN